MHYHHSFFTLQCSNSVCSPWSHGEGGSQGEVVPSDLDLGAEVKGRALVSWMSAEGLPNETGLTFCIFPYHVKQGWGIFYNPRASFPFWLTFWGPQASGGRGQSQRWAEPCMQIWPLYSRLASAHTQTPSLSSIQESRSHQSSKSNVSQAQIGFGAVG